MTEAEWLACKDPARMLDWLIPDTISEDPSLDNSLLSPRKLRLFACACARATGLFAADDYGSARLAVETAERFVDGARAKTLMAKFGGRPYSSTSLFPHALLGSHCCETDASRAARLMVTCHDGPPPAVQAAILRDIAGNPWRPVALPLEDVRVRLPSAVVTDGPSRGPLYGVERRCPWLTPEVLTLARAAYGERVERLSDDDQYEAIPTKIGRIVFRCLLCEYLAGRRLKANHRKYCTGIGTLDTARLAVLSDALEEAGCDNEALLRHLRGDDRSGCRPGVEDCERCAATGRRHAGPHYRGCWAVDLLLSKR